MNSQYIVRDLHIHINQTKDIEPMLAAIHDLGYEAYNVLALSAYLPALAAGNAIGLYLKLRERGKCFAFAGFLHGEEGAATSEELLQQTAAFHRAGFDGIKMIEGKPGVRCRIGVPLDDARFDSAFTYMESNSIPLLYHVNDPADFWDTDKIPVWAKDAGWLVDPASPPFEQVMKEALHAAQKHPKLKIVFAHFFFQSDQLQRAAQILDDYPNVSFDITPGSEMYLNFSKNVSGWRAFFTKYADRILFGTDHMDTVNPAKNATQYRFLETSDEFEAMRGILHGLALEKDTLTKIYRSNFIQFAGKKPRDVCLRSILPLFEYLEAYAAPLSCHEYIANELIEVKRLLEKL